MIESYNLKIDLSSHSADHIDYEAIAYLDVDISPVLPYLNAILPRGIYAPKRPTLSWRQGGHRIGFWPDRIAADNFHSRQEAVDMIARLVKLVNDTWARRAEIEPDETTHPRLQPLQVYQLLPRTNCKACGQASCFNFALQLVAAQIDLDRCTPLYEPAFEAKRVRLEALIKTRWPAL